MIQICSRYLVLREFFIRPHKTYSVAELSRNTKLAHTSITIHLQTLTKEGLIKKDVEIKNTRKFPIYSARTHSKIYTREKKISNYAEILRSGLIKYLEEQTYPECIILFGSYQKGEDTQESDIDLFIQTTGSPPRLKAFEKKLQRNIQIHNAKSITSFDAELQENITNGITLSGFLATNTGQ